MSLTVQNILDDAKATFGGGTTASGDTANDTYLLNKFNRIVYPQFRDIYLRTDAHYFDEIGYADITAGTDVYQPTHNTAGTAYSGGAKRIRRLYSLHVKRTDSDVIWEPLDDATSFQDEPLQVNNTTTFNMWGFMMIGNQVQILDIPNAAVTLGLRFKYVAEMTALAVGATLDNILDDDVHCLINGLAYEYAKKLRNDTLLRQAEKDYLLSQKTVKRTAQQRVDMTITLS